MLCLNVECQLQSKHHRLQDGKEKGNKERTQGAVLQENFWKSNTLWHEAGTHSSGHFPGALRVLQTCMKGAKKIPTKWCHHLQFCRQRKLFHCVESMLLCPPLWTVVAFIWEIAGSIILSSTMVLVFALPMLQQQVTSLWWQHGCFHWRAPNPGGPGVTGLAFLASSYCDDMSWGWRKTVNSKGRLALSRLRNKTRTKGHIILN